MQCFRDSGQSSKFHRAGIAKMRARMKHAAKEKVGTCSTNTEAYISEATEVILATRWSSSGRRPCYLKVRRANRVEAHDDGGGSDCGIGIGVVELVLVVLVVVVLAMVIVAGGGGGGLLCYF